MKSIICGIFAASLVASAAHAEAWSGPYVGVEGGWDNYEVSGQGDLGYLFGLDAEGSFDGFSGDGAVGGIFAGYHYGTDTFFVAVEGFGNLSDAAISASYDEVGYSYDASVEARESYGVAARLGAKVNNSTGVYVRGGWVNTKFRTSESDSDGYRYSESSTEDAIQYGVGIETMLGKNLTLRGEYLISDYGDAGLLDGIQVDNNGFKGGVAFRF